MSKRFEVWKSNFIGLGINWNILNGGDIWIVELQLDVPMFIMKYILKLPRKNETKKP